MRPKYFPHVERICGQIQKFYPAFPRKVFVIYQEMLYIVLDIFSLFGNIFYCLISGLSGEIIANLKVPDSLDTFKIVWKLSRLSGKFPDCLESVQFIWKVKILSEKFLNEVKDFQLIRKFFGFSRTFKIVWKVSRIVWKFPVYIETLSGGFFS